MAEIIVDEGRMVTLEFPDSEARATVPWDLMVTLFSLASRINDGQAVDPFVVDVRTAAITQDVVDGFLEMCQLMYDGKDVCKHVSEHRTMLTQYVALIDFLILKPAFIKAKDIIMQRMLASTDVFMIIDTVGNEVMDVTTNNKMISIKRSSLVQSSVGFNETSTGDDASGDAHVTPKKRSLPSSPALDAARAARAAAEGRSFVTVRIRNKGDKPAYMTYRFSKADYARFVSELRTRVVEVFQQLLDVRDPKNTSLDEVMMFIARHRTLLFTTVADASSVLRALPDVSGNARKLMETLLITSSDAGQCKPVLSSVTPSDAPSGSVYAPTPATPDAIQSVELDVVDGAECVRVLIRRAPVNRG